MEKLTIELDCNKKTCGKCTLTTLPSLMSVHCALFHRRLVSYENYPSIDYYRLHECIAACKEQKE